MTRRAVDYLLSIHAAPFLAKPIAVNVHGLGRDDLERLERAKRPVRKRECDSRNGRAALDSVAGRFQNRGR